VKRTKQIRSKQSKIRKAAACESSERSKASEGKQIKQMYIKQNKEECWQKEYEVEQTAK
jgi:hypothetical protein